MVHDVSTSTRAWREARAKEIHKLLTRSAQWCEACGSRPVDEMSSVHHRKLRSQGGKHKITNLLILCRACHNWAHANPAKARERGIIVHCMDDPALVPVEHAKHGLVRLEPDGTVSEEVRL